MGVPIEKLSHLEGQARYNFRKLGAPTLSTTREGAILEAEAGLKEFIGQFEGLDQVIVTDALKRALSKPDTGDDT